MKIYIASFYDTRDRLRPIIGLLERIGHTVTSRWISQQENEADNITDQDWRIYGERDLEDIRNADILICDTLDETPRGGREVELGYAMALGKLAITVGPKRNIFHRLLPNHRDWPTLLLSLMKDKQ